MLSIAKLISMALHDIPNSNVPPWENLFPTPNLGC